MYNLVRASEKVKYFRKMQGKDFSQRIMYFQISLYIFINRKIS